jgi:alpha-glucoside transport system permease protein
MWPCTGDLLAALTFAQSTTPITVRIAGQLREFGTSVDILVHLARDPLCVFLAFQRYFMRGLPAGSVK